MKNEESFPKLLDSGSYDDYGSESNKDEELEQIPKVDSLEEIG